MMSTTHKVRIFFAFILAITLLAACSSQDSTVTGDNKDAVLAYSEAMTDNLMAGLNADDYEMFSRDFDAGMIKAMNQERFDTFKNDMDVKFGPYVSREVAGVTQSGEYYAVIYETAFEKDNNVVMRVVFTMAEPHQVSGLWFNK